MGQLKIVCAQLGPIDTNTYILMDDEIKEAIIIDPAGSPEELIKFLEDEGYSLDGVLLTHGHHDHIGALEGLREHLIRGSCAYMQQNRNRKFLW